MPGIHTAIIMDGNGRWGVAHGGGRIAGHRAGADAVRRIVEAAPGVGIDCLTLYAFSSDNWRRPPSEVSALMTLLGDFLKAEVTRCREEGVRLEVIGRRDRLSPSLRAKIRSAEEATEAGTRLLLRLAIDYSARDAILAAAATAPRTREEFAAAIALVINSRTAPRDVDLLIRTGREKRLSDFLLWESAYAEIYFSDVLWPEFTGQHLAAAVDDFRRRTRKFGAVDAKASIEAEVACTTS